ncbi:MAG: hypothetical protein ACO2PO_18250 [Candidatus Calescibacterium sp.]
MCELLKFFVVCEFFKLLCVEFGVVEAGFMFVYVVEFVVEGFDE